MKKLNIKITLILSLFALAVFSSCSSDDPISPGGGNNTVTSLGGTIDGGPGGVYIVQATASGNGSAVVGSDTATGNTFDMTLSTPPAVILRQITGFANDSAFTISDTNAFYVQFGDLEARNVANLPIGRIDRRNFNDSAVVGSFQVDYIYCDRNTNITGTITQVSGSDTSKTIVNLTFLTGWNKYYFQLSQSRTNYMELTVASGEPTGGSWRYDAVVSSNKGVLNRKQLAF